MAKKISLIALIVLALPFFVTAQDLQITEVKNIQVLNIDTPTLSRGYTLVSPDKVFYLGVRPEVLAQETKIVLKQYDRQLFDYPEGLAPVSDVYEFDIFNREAFKNKKPLLIRFALNDEVRNPKNLHYYDGNKESWIKLPSDSITRESLKAIIHLPYAKLAVLADQNSLEFGDASWYAYKNCDCAASPDFPKGSLVKVSNLDNDKSVIVRINDYGPDRSIFPKRIIDLDKVAFSKIGNLRAGVLKNIKVELVR